MVVSSELVSLHIGITSSELIECNRICSIKHRGSIACLPFTLQSDCGRPSIPLAQSVLDNVNQPLARVCDLLDKLSFCMKFNKLPVPGLPCISKV